MLELLAPAGSMEALRAAVQNGASAVYLGCGAFNARQSASLYRRLRDVGKSAELYLLEGADHGGAEFWTDGMCRVATDFMRSNCAR